MRLQDFSDPWPSFSIEETTDDGRQGAVAKPEGEKKAERNLRPAFDLKLFQRP